ncbi:hypothetical protein PAPYR_10072 [Paratrimastix pyriformis]|uniref:DNA2/NAM7 helicase-like C-terminal domain-containing protein n=1 Tax=Paratrimastix pyriformis TaxID=342808 RepID=A0ABQ8UDZ3_9EUKA|nr:hypothetical protein PAPYR_10072 [Paratrimastix pyriformis]
MPCPSNCPFSGPGYPSCFEAVRVLSLTAPQSAEYRLFLELEDFLKEIMQYDCNRNQLDRWVPEVAARAAPHLPTIAKLRGCLAMSPPKVGADMYGLHRYLISKARLVFCTVCAAGRSLISQAGFTLALVDEAGQLTEAATSVIFSETLRKLLLAGDYQQLPAPVVAPKAQQGGLGRSLMERILSIPGNQDRTYTLTIQRRMDPAIVALPNQLFYENMLTTDVVVSQRDLPAWSRPENAAKGLPVLRPTQFIDVNTPELRVGNRFLILIPKLTWVIWHSSWVNQGQVDATLEILEVVLRTIPSGATRPSVAIITMYAAQTGSKEARQTLSSCPSSGATPTEISDSFGAPLGTKPPPVLFHFSSSNDYPPPHHPTIPPDAQRINVALTRARQLQFIVGSATTIGASQDFKLLGALLAHHQALDAVMTVDDVVHPRVTRQPPTEPTSSPAPTTGRDLPASTITLPDLIVDGLQDPAEGLCS